MASRHIVGRLVAYSDSGGDGSSSASDDDGDQNEHPSESDAVVAGSSSLSPTSATPTASEDTEDDLTALLQKAPTVPYRADMQSASSFLKPPREPPPGCQAEFQALEGCDRKGRGRRRSPLFSRRRSAPAAAAAAHIEGAPVGPASKLHTEKAGVQRVCAQVVQDASVAHPHQLQQRRRGHSWAEVRHLPRC